jgi:hypothetical protein
MEKKEKKFGSVRAGFESLFDDEIVKKLVILTNKFHRIKKSSIKQS